MAAGASVATRRRNGRRSRGAIYARFSTRFQHSIDDQVRTCHEFAESNDIDVAEEHIFSDEAARGCSTRRQGLDSLKEALSRGKIDVVLIFSTNRLFRKVYRSLQFVEEEIADRGLRCVFIKSGVDTADLKRWRSLLQIHAMMDEFVVQMSGEHIHAAHEGLLDQGMVWGTITYGYRGDPVKGELTKRNRPRRRVVVDSCTAEWVRRIFDWFTNGGLAIAQIIRKLNQDSAPLPPKCGTDMWTRQALWGVITNPRYRGLWEYGRKQTVWQNKKDYARQIPREKPLRSTQRENLRIVSDRQWYAAQARLASNQQGRGRKAKLSDPKKRPKLLNGLFFCAAHNRRMIVGGTNGRYYVCPHCEREANPPMITLLDRAFALKLICEKLASMIHGDHDLVARVVASCSKCAERLQRPDPDKILDMKSREAKISRRIGFILDNPGETSDDQRENAAALAKARSERAQVSAEIARYEALAKSPITIPTSQEVHSMLSHVSSILEHAAMSDDEEEIAGARMIISAITSDRILVSQMGEAKPKRGWLRGSFKSVLVRYFVDQASGGDTNEKGVDVHIDFRRTGQPEVLADDAKAMFDEGILIKEIGERLGCDRNMAKKALNHWFDQHHQKMPDGRSRRSALRRKCRSDSLYQQLAPEVKSFADQGLLLQDIAERLNCDRNTITKSLRYAYKSEGGIAPDGRTRRKDLTRKVSRDRRAG